MLELLGTEEHKRNRRVNEQQIDDSEMVLRLSRRNCAVSGVSVAIPHGFEAALAGNFVLNSTDSVPDDCPVEISYHTCMHHSAGDTLLATFCQAASDCLSP